MRVFGVQSVVACGIALATLCAPAKAQVSSSDQQCITSFNKGIRQVAKTQAKIIRKCLHDFSTGALVTTTPEACLLLDPSGQRTANSNQLITSSALTCPANLPAFGVTGARAAVVPAAVNPIDLVHASIGANLDTDLIPANPGISCQTSVINALMKCQDARIQEYLKCQKTGLRSGAIVDGRGLESVCLGTGDAPQPDPRGKIAKACIDGLGAVVPKRCATTDLAAAFPACNTSNSAGLVACVRAKSGCKLCQLLNAADGLSRDCDRFDDSNGDNGSCGPECADGVVQPEEACDDGNAADGDGCSTKCSVEAGWSCTGSPSTCAPTCGNGAVDADESCDDGNTTNGDGCSSSCQTETGFTCTGSPSACTRNCGDGTLSASEGEACDDHNGNDGDGCSSTCQIEPGFVCSGTPSTCTFVCGNGTFQGAETCDDGNATPGDGCSGICQIESGWICSGQPSHCSPICGDGIVRPGEGCDDGNVNQNDGCSINCQVEAGFTCSDQPSNCIPICGDGFLRGNETCDDGNHFDGDGCSGLFCRQETGWACSGQPSVCFPTCGNGHLDPLEECDDGNLANGDGCNNRCQEEAGWACGGAPSGCVHSCGNGAVSALETCDDGNMISGDGCSASCKNESGWLCNSPGLPCTPFGIFIDSPAHGSFTTAGSVVVTGHYTGLPPGAASITINGVPASSVNQSSRTFSHTVPLNQSIVFNGIYATLTNLTNGDDVHARIVVGAGQSVADGAVSPQSVAFRVNDSGLDTIEPLVAQLAGSSLNLATLIPPNTVLADQCFLNVIGCWGSAKVKIGNPPPSYGSFTFSADSKTDAVGVDVNIRNLRLDVDIDGSGLVPDCGLRITANSLDITGDFGMEPQASDPSHVDVNLVSPIGGTFAGFNYQFTYGICGAPIIGDIIRSLLPDIQAFAGDGIKGFLADPDGSGPADSPIADAIEASLSEISIAGAVGSGVGLQFDAPIFKIAEDNNGLTLGAGSRFSVGSGPGMCVPPPGAPNLTASYSKNDGFPTYGPTSPVKNAPYGIGIGISPAGFNQLLKGQTECGLMRSSLTTIDIDGPGGAPPLAITSSLLSALVPEFGQLPPGTPLRIDIAPTMAPIITGNPGPNGELAELKVAHIGVNIVQPGSETVWLSGAFDVRLGMNLTFDGSGLAVTVSAPGETDTAMTVLYNPLGADEGHIESVLPSVMRPLIPSLAGALSGFPLPQFFGLNLSGVEVSRNGGFLSLFANLQTTP